MRVNDPTESFRKHDELREELWKRTNVRAGGGGRSLCVSPESAVILEFGSADYEVLLEKSQVAGFTLRRARHD